MRLETRDTRFASSARSGSRAVPCRRLASTTEWGRREHRPQGRRTAEGALCVAGRGPRPASSARFKLPGHPPARLLGTLHHGVGEGGRKAGAQRRGPCALQVEVRDLPHLRGSSSQATPSHPRYARAPSRQTSSWRFGLPGRPLPPSLRSGTLPHLRWWRGGIGVDDDVAVELAHRRQILRVGAAAVDPTFDAPGGGTGSCSPNSSDRCLTMKQLLLDPVDGDGLDIHTRNVSHRCDRIG